MSAPSKIETWVHPETCRDAAYGRRELDLTSYRPPEGPWARVESGDATATFATPDGATLRVESHGPNLLRVRVAPPGATAGPGVTERLGLVTVPPPQSLALTEGQDTLTVAAGELRCELGRASHEIAVRDAGGEPLLESVGGGIRFSAERPEFGGARFFARFRLGAERVFGFGGRIARPDRTGASADLFAVGAGQHGGDYGGFPVPFFLSTRGYGVFVNNPWPHLYFDMGRTTPDEWFVHAPGGDCDCFVIRGPEWSRIVSTFTQLVGRLPKPRRWWLGFWTGASTLASADAAVEHCRRYRQGGLPCDAVHLGSAWRGGANSPQGGGTADGLEWRPEFGDAPAVVRLLRAMGLRVALSLDARGGGAGDPAAESRERSLLEARNRDGIGAWVLEDAPLDGEAPAGVPARNLLGTLWTRAVAATGSDLGEPSRVALARGGGIGGQRHAIACAGDTRVGVDFFKEDLFFLMNAGLAGFPLASCDLGGFGPADEFAPPHNRALDPDNLARRVCQSLFFMPVPRIRDDAREPPRLPWNCPPAIRDLYAEMLRLRYRMIPYLFTCLVRAHLTGEPIVRPMAYAHREDAVACGLDDQFLLGEWLLVAPVLGKGQGSRAVYLPAGRWLNFWTDEESIGPVTVRVPAPLERREGLPVFVRSGAILPYQDPVVTLSDRPPATIQLDVYPDVAESEFALYDSPTQRTRIRCRTSGRRVRLDVENGVGFARHYRLRLRGAPPDAALTVVSGAGGTPFTHEIERSRR